MRGSGGPASGLNDVAKDERFVAFVTYFNRDRDYFECHEVMEELWLENGRSSLLQGLLQAAVGLHHWDNGNRSGAVKLMKASLDKLGGYPDEMLGLDLRSLRDELEISLEALAAAPDHALFRAFRLNVLDEHVRIAVEGSLI
ncbi:DUF309 domain-containing protein [Cohnella terricola]|uniref:DUF309 domain-containing protein n=1 Tax=Cohnella terricola TaxID=1289167 RepID=A0A559JW72_9BACL|nr:DUF309 domain-containing protein [Cohnella terricola]TVY04142.1 DUF309 domain-containing protein [Cohnella terricola]